MKYLVDANVLSEPTRPNPRPNVVSWLRRHERALARETDPRSRRRRAYALLARNGFDPETCSSAAAAYVRSGDPDQGDDPESDVAAEPG